MDFIHQFIIRNGEIYPNISEKLSNGTTIYEVIRIIDGIPLFFEQHYYRLCKSASLINKKLELFEEELKQLIHTLIISNKQNSGNIKIIFFYDTETGLSLLKIGFIEHKYPTEKEYAEGVKTVSYIFQRPNPNAKIQYPNFQNDVYGLMQKNNVYEIILVNPDGNITEGSRSNLFFIKDNIIYTAPEKEVLTGITRNVLINLCQKNNFKLYEKPVNYTQLCNMDAAFLTGTSPKLLHINQIDTFNFKVPDKTVEDLSILYNKFIDDYLATHQKFSSSGQ